MDINAEIVSHEDAQVILSIEVKDKSVSDTFDEVTKTYQQKAKINGFRQGKAPINIIRTKYKEYIEEDVLKKLLPKVVEESLKKVKLENTFSVPKIKELDFKDENSIKFMMEVETPPEVELGPYTELTFTRDEFKVSKKDIDNELEKMRDYYADYVAKDNNLVEDNDVVTVKMDAYLDDNLLKEYSNENYKLEISKDKVIKEFYEGLLNSKLNEEKSIIVEYPNDFNDKKLSGKKVTYKINIKDIRTKKLSPLNDDFAKDVGDYKNLKELKDKLEEQLMEYGNSWTEEKLENDIIEKVIQASKFKIPKSMIKSHYDYIYNRIETDFRRRGYNLDENIKSGSIDANKLQGQARDEAIRDLKVYLMLKEIQEKEKIDITEEDVDSEAKRIAERYKQKFEDFKNKLTETEKIAIKQQIRSHKVLNFLKEHNKIKKGKKITIQDIDKK